MSEQLLKDMLTTHQTTQTSESLENCLVRDGISQVALANAYLEGIVLGFRGTATMTLFQRRCIAKMRARQMVAGLSLHEPAIPTLRLCESYSYMYTYSPETGQQLWKHVNTKTNGEGEFQAVMKGFEPIDVPRKRDEWD